jgi:hypothetical protein
LNAGYGKSKLGRRRLLLPFPDKPTAAFVSREVMKAKKQFFGSVAAASRNERLAKADEPPEGKSPSVGLPPLVVWSLYTVLTGKQVLAVAGLASAHVGTTGAGASLVSIKFVKWKEI